MSETNYSAFVAALWGFIKSIPGHQEGRDFVCARVEGDSLSYYYHIHKYSTQHVPDYWESEKFTDPGTPWDMMHSYAPFVEDLGGGVYMMRISEFTVIAHCYKEKPVHQMKKKSKRK